jgi:hypothetical protein
MAVNWYVDEGVLTLGNEWKKAHPGAVVYYVGDVDHSHTESDHNPEVDGSLPGADLGEVDAADFMINTGGVTHEDLQGLADGLIRSRDPRIAYVIWNRRICSSRKIGSVPAWTWRAYTGKSAHTDHVHLSVNDDFDRNTSHWKWEDEVARTLTWSKSTLSMPVHKYGDEDAQFEGYNRIARAQAAANWLEKANPLDEDGVYGAKTAAKVSRIMSKVEKKSSTNGRVLDLPEWRVLFGLGV